MAVTDVALLRTRSGCVYTFTVDGSSVKVRDNGTRSTAWEAFTLPDGALKVVSVVEWESGMLEAVYVKSDGSVASKYSFDDGKTWE